MIVASGYIEANEIKDVETVVRELQARNIEVNEVKEEKIVFLVERDTAEKVKAELDTLKDIEGVRGVYLAYFSLEEGEVN